MDVDSSDVLITEDGDGGPQGDTHIAVCGSVHGSGGHQRNQSPPERSSWWWRHWLRGDTDRVHVLEGEGGRGGASEEEGGGEVWKRTEVKGVGEWEGEEAWDVG